MEEGSPRPRRWLLIWCGVLLVGAAGVAVAVISRNRWLVLLGLFGMLLVVAGLIGLLALAQRRRLGPSPLRELSMIDRDEVLRAITTGAPLRARLQPLAYLQARQMLRMPHLTWWLVTLAALQLVFVLVTRDSVWWLHLPVAASLVLAAANLERTRRQALRAASEFNPDRESQPG